jgi:hypothetical protein
MATTDVSVAASVRPDVEAKAKVSVVAGGIVAAILLAMMPMRLAAYAHDALIQLEGAWRIHQGMQIHEGVHTPMGALYPYLLVLGIWLFGPMPHAFLVPALLPLPLVCWLGWTILRPRFGPRTTALLTLFLVAILVGPTCLGDPVAFGINWQRTTFGMQYNRVIWPFATLLGALCLIPPRAVGETSQRREALLIGLLLGICFFGKVNYFLGGAILALIALFRCRDRGIFVGWATLGFAGVTIFFAALNVPLGSYLYDLWDLGRAQSTLDRLQQVGVLVGVNFEYLVVIGAIRFALGNRGRGWLMTAAIILVGYGVVVGSANYQERVLPPLILALFAVAEHMRREAWPGGDLTRIARVISVGYAGGLVLFTGLAFFPAYAYLPEIAHGQWPGVTENAHAPFYLGSLVPEGSASEATVRLTDKQANACDRLFRKGAVVYRLGWYNVLPVLRQAPSPRGLLWYHGGRTVTRETLPPPSRELQGVDGIVWPKNVDKEDELIIEAYKGYVTQYFVLLDADETASYWRRR